MSDIAIKVENLSKYYKLGVINSGTLSRDLQSRLYKMLGKEDPNKQIGAIESDAEGFWALKDLNFEIKKGDRVGIIGRNGAGKSTLLKMLSQISSPTKGKIYIDGKIASLLEVGTGFNPELTGRENIYLNGAILGMKKKEVDRKIDEIIAFSEIEKHIDTPVKRYSSGMYVRLAFAVAAHLDSEILIADEVLAVGDANFQKKALGKMNELSTGEGRTVLFVSHNMSQVKTLCNKGILLHKGELSYSGNITEVCDRYLGAENISNFRNLRDYKPNFTDNSISVLSISCLDFESNESVVFAKNQKARFSIEVYSKETQSCSLAVSIANYSGVLFSVNNELQNYQLLKNTKYTLYFEFENYLLPGRYTMHFGFNAGRETFWWGTDVLSFEVLYEKQNISSGFFNVESKFGIEEK